MAAAREKLGTGCWTTVPVLNSGRKRNRHGDIANLLHTWSNRSKGAWVKVACPAIPHSLIESELFGYEKGAFTGAYATKRGRVLELGQMGKNLFWMNGRSWIFSVQAKLLQMLQDGVSCGVGGQRVEEGQFRLVSRQQDLRQQAEERQLQDGFLLTA